MHNKILFIICLYQVNAFASHSDKPTPKSTSELQQNNEGYNVWRKFVYEVRKAAHSQKRREQEIGWREAHLPTLFHYALRSQHDGTKKSNLPSKL